MLKINLYLIKKIKIKFLFKFQINVELKKFFQLLRRNTLQYSNTLATTVLTLSTLKNNSHLELTILT